MLCTSRQSRLVECMVCMLTRIVYGFLMVDSASVTAPTGKLQWRSGDVRMDSNRTCCCCAADRGNGLVNICWSAAAVHCCP